MLARSSRHSVAVACALAACSAACGGKHAKPRPEADPATFVALADQIVRNVPAPGAARDCKPEDLVGATMTQVTLLKIVKQPVANDPEHADWVNPPQLDSEDARLLADPKTSPEVARQAAAALLAAPGYVVYRVDLVNAPMALGVKDPKIGTIGARVFAYDKTGTLKCALVYAFQNTQAKSDWAIAHATHAIVEPEIAKMLREDLTAQYLKNAPRGPR